MKTTLVALAVLFLALSARADGGAVDTITLTDAIYCDAYANCSGGFTWALNDPADGTMTLLGEWIAVSPAYDQTPGAIYWNPTTYTEYAPVPDGCVNIFACDEATLGIGSGGWTPATLPFTQYEQQWMASLVPYDGSPNPVPEPSTRLLIFSGLILVAIAQSARSRMARS